MCKLVIVYVFRASNVVINVAIIGIYLQQSVLEIYFQTHVHRLRKLKRLSNHHVFVVMHACMYIILYIYIYINL